MRPFCILCIGLGSFALSAPLAAQEQQQLDDIMLDESANGAQPAQAQPAPMAEQAPMEPQPQPPQAAQTPLPYEEDLPQRAPNTIYVEGLGPGVYYSLNYERLVIPDLAVRLGLGVFTLTATAGTASSSALFLNIPLTVSYLGLGSDHHMMEIGAGMTMSYVSAASSSGFSSASGSGVGVLGNFFAGYRLHPVGGAGFNFRVGVNVMFAKGFGFSPDVNKIGFLPLPYMSAGASF